MPAGLFIVPDMEVVAVARMRELLAGLFIIIIYLQALVSLLYDGTSTRDFLRARRQEVSHWHPRPARYPRISTRHALALFCDCTFVAVLMKEAATKFSPDTARITATFRVHRFSIFYSKHIIVLASPARPARLYAGGGPKMDRSLTVGRLSHP